jgi:hypothetical protein
MVEGRVYRNVQQQSKHRVRTEQIITLNLCRYKYNIHYFLLKTSLNFNKFKIIKIFLMQMLNLTFLESLSRYSSKTGVMTSAALLRFNE